MTIHKSDLDELRRMATNVYDNDKKFLNRVIMGIGIMESEIRKLTEENSELKKKAKELKVANKVKLEG
jgi:ATP-dependent DNA ligase